MHTIEQIIADVCTNHKTNRWLSRWYQTEYGDIGIKAYGKWVQIIEFSGMRTNIPEQKTIKALRHELSKTINDMVKI